MKKTFLWIFKAAVAGILALATASAVCLIYYNPGIHITNETGATDYRWIANSFQSNMTEGIAWNLTDKNGFYNSADAPDKNMNVLIMGSSNMEGTHVFTKQNVPYLLSELTGLSVYNIGISEHTLLTCVSNLENALSAMQPTDYVIIESLASTFSAEAIEKCVSGEMKNFSSHDSGILFYLQKIPYLKLVYAQLVHWNAANSGGKTSIEEKGPENTAIQQKIPMDSYIKLAEKIQETCRKHSVQPVIFYHPNLSLNYDGSAAAKLNEESLAALEAACEANGILFVDMTDAFLEMYRESNVLPNGFCNTGIGTGHLNKHGNRAIAQKLAEVISAQEGDKQ